MTGAPPTSPPAARVRNLTKTYGAGQALVTALDDVTPRHRPGVSSPP